MKAGDGNGNHSRITKTQARDRLREEFDKLLVVVEYPLRKQIYTTLQKALPALNLGMKQ